MHAILDFLFRIINTLLTLSVSVVVISAILSWLVAFNVINVRNRAVAQIVYGLEAVTRPLLQPIRRILPSFGGMDFSPIIFIVVVGAIQSALLRPFFGFLHGLVGGTATVV